MLEKKQPQTEDALYHEVPFDEPMIGHAAIRQYWEEDAEQSQTDILL